LTERDIFIAALHQRDPGERAAFLDRACGSDEALRVRVEELLREQEELGSFLERPAEGVGGTGLFTPAPNDEVSAAPVVGLGTIIGPYQLIEAIGEGGMGTVFMAQQIEPVKRLVALKVIKPGMDSKQVVARFDSERQALALMDHPNIARVLDAGTTAAGRPYFVMELVKGVPITKYCDQNRLSPRERLRLFLAVCQAVQHAHQKGVIHRDIKPSNVLVALCDGQPVVKVIDFGIAKAAGAPLTERTLLTGLGMVIGTPEYMSPEQAELNNLDIDTRSDVYALGVLLYELLTGTTPLTRKRVQELALLELLRLVREEEPPSPSTRLSSSAELPAVAANRHMEPSRLTKFVRGELDWIVMKCLEKDRNRRYDTASSFAADVQRYLSDEPVQACPPSVGYRFRKFMRRNKGPALAAALVLLVLVGGIIGTTWGMISAETESGKKDEAIQARDLAFGSLGQKERAARVDLAILRLDKGLEFCEKGEVDLGLLWLARGLEAAPEDAGDLQRVLRINLAAWSHQTSRLRGIFPHEGSEYACSSPDGKTVLTCKRDQVRLWDAATGRLIGEHNGAPLYLWPNSRKVAFSNDGTRLLTSTALGVQCWDTATGRPIGKPLTGQPRGDPLPVSEFKDGVVFSADSKVVLTVLRGWLGRWDVATGHKLGKEGELGGLGWVSFSRDGKIVGSILGQVRDQNVRFWDTATGQALGQSQKLVEGTVRLIFSPDGRTALTQGGNRGQLWNPATCQPIGPVLTFPGFGEVEAAAFSPDGKTVALVGKTHFQQWAAATGTPVGNLTPVQSRNGLPELVLFGERDSLFARGSFYRHGRPRYAQLLHPYLEDEVRTWEPSRKVEVLGLTPAGAIVLVEGESDGVGQLWNAATGEVVGAPLPCPHAAQLLSLGYPAAVSFSPDLRMYVTRTNQDAGIRGDGIPRLWELGSGKPYRRPLPIPHLDPDDLLTVAFSPDARFLLAAKSTPRIPRSRQKAWLGLFERRGGELGRVDGENNDRINCLAAAFSPDGRLVLAAHAPWKGPNRLRGGDPFPGVGPEPETHLWAAEAGKLSSRWKGVGVALAFSPDGKRFVEGGASEDPKSHDEADRRAVRLWDVATLKPLVPPLQHSAPVQAVAFSPDGTILLTGCGDPRSAYTQGGEARLWDVATGQPARRASGGPVLPPLPHQGAVVALAFSPDGKFVLTGSTDRAARLWDTATGQLLGPPLLHKGKVTRVAFSKDGCLLLTMSRDHTTRLWDAATRKPLGPPLHHLQWDIPQTFVAFSPEDQAVLTAGTDGNLMRWEVETSPLRGDVKRVLLWVQVLTGKELDTEGVAGGLGHETWHERRRQLKELGGPPLP
jgi:serine/threonine protein kinase/WD40 repeat protein